MPERVRRSSLSLIAQPARVASRTINRAIVGASTPKDVHADLLLGPVELQRVAPTEVLHLAEVGLDAPLRAIGGDLSRRPVLVVGEDPLLKSSTSSARRAAGSFSITRRNSPPGPPPLREGELREGATTGFTVARAM
jgi:hypothetical protein